MLTDQSSPSDRGHPPVIWIDVFIGLCLAAALLLLTAWISRRTLPGAPVELKAMAREWWGWIAFAAPGAIGAVLVRRSITVWHAIAPVALAALIWCLGATTGSNADCYISVQKAFLKGNTSYAKTPMPLSECKARCSEDPQCRSFDYYTQQELCERSTNVAIEYDNLLGSRVHDYYQKVACD